MHLRFFFLRATLPLKPSAINPYIFNILEATALRKNKWFCHCKEYFYVLYLGKGGAVLTFIHFLLKFRVLKGWILFPALFPLSLCCFPPLWEDSWTKPLLFSTSWDSGSVCSSVMKLFQCLELKKRGTLLMQLNAIGCQCHAFALWRVGPAPAGTMYSKLKQLSSDSVLLDGG